MSLNHIQQLQGGDDTANFSIEGQFVIGTFIANVNTQNIIVALPDFEQVHIKYGIYDCYFQVQLYLTFLTCCSRFS